MRFVMPTIRGAQTGSKKRYAGYIRNRSGALELKFKGLESVRSDWTPLAREFQRELYRLVFFDLPYRDYIRQTVEQLKRANWIRNWSIESACAAPLRSTSATYRPMCRRPASWAGRRAGSAT
ncbi:MAG: DNA polymerase domain-containing protein [Candidatus Sedimenticola endophacoides]